MKSKIFKSACALFIIFCAALFSIITYFYCVLPDSYYINEGGTLSLSEIPEIEAVYNKTDVKKTVKTGNEEIVSLRLYGILPLKQVTVREIDENSILVCGSPFGIKMFTDGVLVCGTNDVKTASGMINPATEAGIKVSDIILKIGGETVASNEDVAKAVRDSQGKSLAVTLRRDNLVFEVVFTPVYDENAGCYKAGLWVRDSSAGIGTLTYYDPETGVFGGLGHAVCDIDTGDILPLSGGSITSASISGVIKGAVGKAGELRGGFTGIGDIGTLVQNTECGVFGTLNSQPKYTVPMLLALKQEIVTGEAEVYTTVLGDKPQKYSVEIERISSNGEATKNMVIRITDPRLIEETGGIVQGMSGSPIVQNGKLIGAITHVLVSDPTRGYAVFAENMMDVSATIDPAA